MALFQRKPDSTSITPLYTLGANRTVLIVGLGNPGQEYKNTRHNIGFEVADRFAAANSFPGWLAKKDLKCTVSLGNLGDKRVILCKPSTFMNNSGEAVQVVQQFYKISNSQTLVIYDELAIEFGSIRTRVGGSDAGHNGVKSLIQHIGEDFNRLRVGVANDLSQKSDAADLVLGKFNATEQEKMPLIIQEAQAVITEFVFGDSLPHETRNVL